MFVHEATVLKKEMLECAINRPAAYVHVSAIGRHFVASARLQQTPSMAKHAHPPRVILLCHIDICDTNFTNSSLAVVIIPPLPPNVTNGEPSHSNPRQWKHMLIHQGWFRFTVLCMRRLLTSPTTELEISISIYSTPLH